MQESNRNDNAGIELMLPFGVGTVEQIHVLAGIQNKIMMDDGGAIWHHKWEPAMIEMRMAL